MHVSFEHPATGERQDRIEQALLQNSGQVDDDIQISTSDVFHKMYIRELLRVKVGSVRKATRRS